METLEFVTLKACTACAWRLAWESRLQHVQLLARAEMSFTKQGPQELFKWFCRHRADCCALLNDVSA